MASTEEEYKPVPGAFREELELLAMLRKPCEIIFRSEHGARTVIRAAIEALFTSEGREWLRTASGLVIGLDKLVQVNGMNPSNYC